MLRAIPRPLVWALFLALALAAFGQRALAQDAQVAQVAQDAAAYYQDKTIKLVVGYGPGGGYDTLARMIAPQLEAKTGATVVVENRPGAGGIIALNQVAAAEPDGLTLMLINGENAASGQLFGVEGVRYDLTQIVWLGRMTAEPRVMLWSAKAPFRTLAEAADAGRAIKWASSGRVDSMSNLTALVSDALDLNSKIIMGYKGSKDAVLAAVRGEVDGITLSASSARKYAKKNNMIPVVTVARQRALLLPDLPTIFEVADLSAAQARWIDYFVQVSEIGRALVTTPGVADARVAFLRRAIRDVLTDPAFVADAKKKKRLINYAAAEQLDHLTAGVLSSLSADELAHLKSIVLDKYF